MAAEFRSLLYTDPRLYDLVFPDADDTTGRMLRGAFERYLAGPPGSLLDVGCGTGRLLESMSRTVPECWGIDLLESNIAYARSVRPGLALRVGDMRMARLGHRFDVVACFGNALSYALTDADLARTVDTFAAHARPGTLLALDALNARSYLEGDGFVAHIASRVETPEFTASSESHHTLDRETRILTRRRTWHIRGRSDVEDYARYRLLEPEELTRLIEAGGFQMRDLFDNREFRSTELRGRPVTSADPGGMAGRKLYAFALAS